MSRAAKSRLLCLNGSKRRKPNNKKALAVLKHDQSRRPDQRKPIMTNANRATRKGGKKSTSAQSANAPKNPPRKTQPDSLTGNANPEQSSATRGMIIPSLASIAMSDALATFRVKAGEALTLALILADRVRTDMHAFAGYEDFEQNKDMPAELVQLVFSARVRLNKVTDVFEATAKPSLSVLRNATIPVARLQLTTEQHIEAVRLRGLCDLPHVQFEHCGTAVAELLDIIASLLSTRKAGVYYAARCTADELETAIENLLQAARDVDDALIAIAAASANQHREAA